MLTGTEQEANPAARAEAWDERQRLDPVCLFAGAGAWVAHDKAKASRLYAMALIRGRYDFGRCTGLPDGALSSMFGALRMGIGGKLLEQGVQVGPEQIAPVANDPATYRYPTGHLARLCGEVKPAGQWPAEEAKMKAEVAEMIRQGLRGSPGG